MKTENFYDEYHMSKYNRENRVLEQREIKSLKIISDNIQLANTVSCLDLGCGDGFFLRNVIDMLGDGVTYYGGEYSEHQRNIADMNCAANISYVDLEDGLNFSDESFDFVYSGEVIEHLYNPDLMVREIFRILKSGGKCVITTPNMNSWISRILFPLGFQPINYECSTVSSSYGLSFLKKIKKQDWPIGHVRLFNRNSLVDLFVANGFRVQKIQGARFEFMPSSLRALDKLFARVPSLASGLIILAEKIA